MAATENTPTREKRVRTCIACGSKGTKSGLLRIVRTDGEVVFDASGRANGRGAYVCGEECFANARNGRLQKALRTKVDSEVCDVIAGQLHDHIASREVEHKE